MNDTEYLQHFGVKGMKWGVRKSPEVASARSAYKTAKKDLKNTVKYARRKSGLGIGIKSVQKNKDFQDRINKADLKVLDAKAKYAASKAKNENAANKAEFKTYKNAMQKIGIRGSYYDNASGGRATLIYDHVKVKKGKSYADAMEKKVQDTTYRQLAALVGATVITTGASFVSLMMDN